MNYYYLRSFYQQRWVSSLSGINVLNGHQIKHYYPNSKSLRGGLIQSNFHEDKIGDVWFSTQNELNRYIRKYDSFKWFQKEGLEEENYRLIGLVDNENLLVQIGDSICFFNKDFEEWETISGRFDGVNYYLDSSTDQSLFTVYGTRWANGDGVLRFSYSDKSGISLDTLIRGITSYEVAGHQNQVWVTSNLGLIELGENNQSRYIEKGIQTRTCYLDSINNRVLYNNGTSINEYYFNSGRINPITITDYTILRILDYSDGVITYLSEEEGIKTFNENENPFQQIGSGVQNIFTIKNGNDNQIFVGTKDGVIYKVSTDVTKQLNSTGRNPFIYKNIIGSNNGIYYLIDNQKLIDFKYPGSFQGFSFAEDIYYLFGDRGMIKRNSKSGFQEILYDSVFFRSITNHKKKVITAGDENIYLFQFSDNNEIELVTNIPHNLSINQFYWVNDDEVLIATNAGIHSLDIPARQYKSALLSNVYIQSLIIDHNNHLWAGTRNGLYRIKEKGETTFYNKKTGLPMDVFSQNCVTSTSDGTLWWGTTDGVLYFHPDSIKDEPFNPPMLLTSLKIHGREWADDTINVEVINEVELKYNENTLTFDFVAVDYNEYSHPQYSVYLEGFDSDTTLLGDQSVITYPNMPPGDYTFWYSACNLSGTCRDEFKPFHVSISPPYWETWWFRSAMGILALSIVAGGIRLYIRNRLREQQFAFEKKELELKNELQLQEERNRIADELHDELGGKLSTIKFAGKKVQKANSLEEVKSINNRVSEVSTELIDSMRSIIWAMDTHNDNLASLMANIRQYASALGRDNDLKVSFDFQVPEEEVVVKGQTRHHLYLIIKELLNNIIKHSSADQVRLQSQLQEDQLTITISENGQGFHLDQVSNPGKGLRSIRKRATIINATITYQQDPQMTTEINLPI